jgi:hypothetical protein
LGAYIPSQSNALTVKRSLPWIVAETGRDVNHVMTLIARNDWGTFAPSYADETRNANGTQPLLSSSHLSQVAIGPCKKGRQRGGANGMTSGAFDFSSQL